MGFYTDTANLIKKFEGFAKKAYWDVNAYRVGYGSDTLTLPDNTFRKVVKGDTTTEPLASLDLQRRIQNEFEPRVIKQLGKQYYDALPDTAKSSLLSLAYNYGSIPKKAIIDAAKTGDVNKLAAAIVDSTKNDNKGTLQKRRKEEASYAMSFVKAVKGAASYAGEKIEKNPLMTIALVAILVVSAWYLKQTLKS